MKMRHYDEISTFTRDGFTIIVDKTYEDIDPWDQLSECFDDRQQLYKDIENCKYEWFMLRVRVMLSGHEMGCTYLGGCLYDYDKVKDVLTDGTVEDCLIEVLREAKLEARKLQGSLQKVLESLQKVLDSQTV
jgi:hypothetical protein